MLTWLLSEQARNKHRTGVVLCVDRFGVELSLRWKLVEFCGLAEIIDCGKLRWKTGGRVQGVTGVSRDI